MRLALAVVALVLVAGCGSNASTGDKGYVSGGGVPTQYAPSERKAAPSISGTTLQGKQISVKALAAGRPTVLNMWASWCTECREEARALNQAATTLGAKASFVGVNVRDPGAEDNARAYERSMKVPYPSIYDPDGRTLLGMPKGVSASAIPSTIVLDGEGRVAATVIGKVPSALTLEELVKAAT